MDATFLWKLSASLFLMTAGVHVRVMYSTQEWFYNAEPLSEEVSLLFI
jgi:hypothetical protein